MQREVVAVVAVLIACHRDAPIPSAEPDGLVAYLDTLAGTDATTRRDAVAGWELDRARWNRIGSPPIAACGTTITHASRPRRRRSSASYLARVWSPRASTTRGIRS